MASTPERLSGERPPRRSRAAKVKSRRPMSSRSVARRIGPAICISKRATRHAAPLRSGRETAEPNRRRKSAMRSRVRQRWWLAAGIAFSAAACERRTMLEPRPGGAQRPADGAVQQPAAAGHGGEPAALRLEFGGVGGDERTGVCVVRVPMLKPYDAPGGPVTITRRPFAPTRRSRNRDASSRLSP